MWFDISSENELKYPYHISTHGDPRTLFKPFLGKILPENEGFIATGVLKKNDFIANQVLKTDTCGSKLWLKRVTFWPQCFFKGLYIKHHVLTVKNW